MDGEEGQVDSVLDPQIAGRKTAAFFPAFILLFVDGQEILNYCPRFDVEQVCDSEGDKGSRLQRTGTEGGTDAS